MLSGGAMSVMPIKSAKVRYAFDRAVRVAILADTHGELDARIAALVATCDLAIHGGDIGQASILARLQPVLGHVLAVRGNNDVASRWPAGEQSLLVRIPEWTELELPGGWLAVIHGHQHPARDRHARLRGRFPRSRAIVYGHSHRLVLDLDACPWVLNPGAAGRARTGAGPSCLVLTADPHGWNVESYRFDLASQRPRRRASQRSAEIPPRDARVT